MLKRGKVAITIDILEATLNPQKKMKIMYKTNLNYLRFNRYLTGFLKKGFIEPVKDLEGNVARNCWRCLRELMSLGFLMRNNFFGCLLFFFVD
jgi:hypothetical protein